MKRLATRPATAPAELADWRPRPAPTTGDMVGRHVRLERFAVDRHADRLFDVFADDPDGALWRYMPVGPFVARADYADYCRTGMTGVDPLFFAVVDGATGRAVGSASYMNIVPANGSIEVGSIVFSRALQRTRSATEAMYLMARRAFDELGYRRYEWKCDSANQASRQAALRLGFVFEGIFRHHMVVKNRNRDTAWFSITDDEWPLRRAALEAWLDDDNFGRDGRQKESLARIREALASKETTP